MDFWITLVLITLLVLAASFVLGEWLARRARRRREGRVRQGM